MATKKKRKPRPKPPIRLSKQAQALVIHVGRDEARKAARHALWRKGDLSWALHSDQLEARQQIDEAEAQGERRFVFMCGRRWGKTRYFMVDAFEFCLKNPGVTIPYAALTLESAEQFVMPEARFLAEWAPPDQKVVILEGIIRFHNGSEIIVAGTETQLAANRLRGRPAPRAYCDEAAFNKILVYVIESALSWTLLTTDGLLFIGSSPPLSPAHAFAKKYVATAMKAGTLIRRKTSQAPHIKPAILKKLCDDMGGPESVEWRREGECELLTDEKRAVVPEYSAHRERVAVTLEEWPKPPTHRLWYFAADLGYADGSAVLGAWHDFLNGRLMVEDERILPRPTSDVVQAASKEMEDEHVTPGEQVVSRVADAALITIADMAKLQPKEVEEPARWRMTAKDNLEGAVNAVRVRVKRHEVWIHPRCSTLLSHLEFAIWNERRTEFERLSEDEAGESGLRHFDALAALIYLVRSVDWTRNPYPPAPIPSQQGGRHVPAHILHPPTKYPKATRGRVRR